MLAPTYTPGGAMRRALRMLLPTFSLPLSLLLWMLPSLHSQPLPVKTGTGIRQESATPAQQKWREALARSATAKAGCFTAAYPSTTFRSVPCGAVVAKPHLRNSRLQHPLDESASGNHTALSAGSITSATGSFPIIDNVTSVQGFGLNNEFSIQMNTNGYHAPQCNNTTNAGCTGIQQFIVDSGGGLEIQVWLLSYLDTQTTQCPSGNTWNVNGSACWRNAATTNFPIQPFSAFSGMTVTGTATANGLDTMTMTVGNQAFRFNAPDSSLGLAGNWKDVDFNVYGESNNEAVFNPGSTMSVMVTLVDGTATMPTCSGQGVGGAQTVETSNLTLGPCTPFGAYSNGIKFVEGVLPVVQSINPASGNTRGGALVTITGTGLSKNMEAGFGSSYVGVQQCNGSTQCTAYAPAGTGTVDVTIANLLDDGEPAPFSTVNPAVDQFTYQVLPWGYLLPSSGLPTGGTTVYIQGGDFSTAPGATTAAFAFSTGTVTVPVTCNSSSQCTMTTPPLSPSDAAPVSVPVTLTTGGNSVAVGSFAFTYPKVIPPPPTCQTCTDRGQRCVIKLGKVTCVGTIQ